MYGYFLDNDFRNQDYLVQVGSCASGSNNGTDVGGEGEQFHARTDMLDIRTEMDIQSFASPTQGKEGEKQEQVREAPGKSIILPFT